MIVDIATGEAEDVVSEAKRHPASVRGRAGGIIGGVARAKTLTREKRSAIAKKAAKARWKDSNN
jgi:hypothetical protein